jgi:hypothetical protein
MTKLSIKTLKDFYSIWDYIKEPIFWIGVTAFMRIIPGLLLKDKFWIIAYKDGLDLEILNPYTEVFCLQKHKVNNLKKINTLHILEHPISQKYIKRKHGKHIIVYKNNEEIEQTIKKLKLKVLAPKAKIRDVFENKKKFRNILGSLNIEKIPWENMHLNTFLKKNYNTIIWKYWRKIVIQLPDIKIWGGAGTFFINTAKEFKKFQEKINKREYKKTQIKSVNITKFINGISSSIIGCATQYWTLSSSIQTQLIDIPEVINTNKWQWLFCWHDRSLHHFWKKIEQETVKNTEIIGNYMYNKGYKGIFGLDLLIDIKNKKVYIVECNARYTWAFPMISLLDIKEWLLPMDIFHILEHLKIPYTINFKKINKQYKYKKEGSHIILSNKYDKEVVCKKDLKAWIYTYKENKLNYLRPGIWYSDIKTNDEFIIIDGNPKKDEKIKAFDELSKFVHLLFPGKIALQSNKLNKNTKEIIKSIYSEYIK